MRSLWRRSILAVTGHFRGRRYRLLLERFPALRDYVVCDLGGSKHFWWSVSDDVRPRRVEILNIDEQGMDAAGFAGVEFDAGSFHFEVYDGRHIEREDDFFDLVLCNSVIEHVPPEQRPGLAVEMQRVAPRVFVQTPAKAFPIDPHFVMPLVHWIPRPLGRLLARVSIFRLLSGASLATTMRYFDGTQLLTRREMQRLFPDAAIHVERVLGLPKSYIAVIDAPT